MKKLLFILLSFTFNIVLAQCEKTCNKEKKEYKNAIYLGCLKDNQPEGWGTMEFTSGDNYTGCWENGKQEGYGTMKLKSGYSYTGYWKNGKQHGEGSSSDTTNAVWIGTWHEGEQIEGRFEHENYYNKDHIQGGKKFSTIHLNQIENEDGAGCLKIELSFNNVKQDFLFDTGCSEMLISSKFLEKIKSNGVKTKKLISSTATTATNTKIKTENIIIYDVVVGDYMIKELAVSVVENGSFLCGIGLLKKFDNAILNFQENKLKLYK